MKIRYAILLGLAFCGACVSQGRAAGESDLVLSACTSATKFSLGIQLPAAAYTVFAGDRLETLSRYAHARSLEAASAEEFRALQLKALAYEKKHRGLLAAALAGSVATPAFAMFGNEVERFLKRRGPGPLTFFDVATCLTVLTLPIWAVKVAKSNRRIKMHQRYVRYADKLFAQLQDSEFMADMGVELWDDVAEARLKAERLAQALGFIPGVSILLKPIVSLVGRKNRKAVHSLEKQLNAYLDELESRSKKKKAFSSMKCNSKRPLEDLFWRTVV